MGGILTALFGSYAASRGPSYDSIQTVTVGAGGQSTISFTSIPQSYAHLQVRMITRSSANVSEDSMLMRFNSDSGSNYRWHFLFGNGSTANSSNNGGTSTFIYPYAIPGATFLAGSFGVQVIDIFDYSSTNKNKTTKTFGGYDNNSTLGRIAFTSGVWFNTNSVTSLTFTCAGNFVQNSSFALYGIKR
jgi:hypothetical protein